MPHPAMTQIGQKYPRPLNAHTTTRNVFTITYDATFDRKARFALSRLIAAARGSSSWMGIGRLRVGIVIGTGMGGDRPGRNRTQPGAAARQRRLNSALCWVHITM